jgi:tetratricopeptide (TPR) repeat protein
MGCSGGQTQAETPEDAKPKAGRGQGIASPSSEKVAKAINFIRAEAFENAKSILLEAIAEDPEDPQAAFYLGVASERLGDIKGAKQYYNKALDLDPTLVEAAINLSALLLDSGDAKGAVAAAEKGLARDPKHAGLLTNKALALEKAGMQAEALDAYAKAIEVSPNEASLRLGYGELLIAAGKKDEALAQLREVHSSKDTTILAAASRQFGKLKEYEDCVKVLETALGIKPDAELYVFRGVCRYGMKQMNEAKADFEAALQTDARSATAHYYLGRHIAGEGQREKAIEHLDEAAKIAGDNDFGKKAKDEADKLRAAIEADAAKKKKK